VEQPRAFLDESFIVGLRAANDLDLGDVGLNVSLASTTVYPWTGYRPTESMIFSTLLWGTLTSSIVTVRFP